MKKMLFSVLIGMAVLAGFQAQAADTNVYSPNVVGFVQISLPATNGLVPLAPAFNAIGTGTNNPLLNIQDVLGTNQYAANLNKWADHVYIWNGSTYDISFLPLGYGVNDYVWSVLDPDTHLPVSIEGNPSNQVAQGIGFWLARGRGPATNAFLTGEVPTAPSVTNTILPGLTLIGNPYPATNSLDNLIPYTTSGVHGGLTQGKSDQVYFWNGTGYDVAWLTGARGDPSTDNHWCFGSPPALCATNDVFTVKPGVGLWYYAKSPTNFSWVVNIPYSVSP